MMAMANPTLNTNADFASLRRIVQLRSAVVPEDCIIFNPHLLPSSDSIEPLRIDLTNAVGNRKAAR